LIGITPAVLGSSVAYRAETNQMQNRRYDYVAFVRSCLIVSNCPLSMKCVLRAPITFVRSKKVEVFHVHTSKAYKGIFF